MIKNLSAGGMAFAFTLLLQFAAGVWWAASAEAEDRFRDQRLGELEARGARFDGGYAQVIERLARLEVHAGETQRSLRRIESWFGPRQ